MVDDWSDSYGYEPSDWTDEVDDISDSVDYGPDEQSPGVAKLGKCLGLIDLRVEDPS